MVNLFIHGWEITPIWFKCIFIMAVLNAIWYICEKAITRIVGIYFEKELLKNKMKFLILKRDLIRDYMIRCGWKCYEKDKTRYYESGLVKMTELDVFKNIILRSIKGKSTGELSNDVANAIFDDDRKEK